MVEALRANPAGNADETTPLVLIRPGDRSGRQPRDRITGGAASRVVAAGEQEETT